MTPMTPPTILVVDDVLEVRRLTRRFLEAGGYRVLEAGDGGQALACLQHQGPVDLVLTDVRMPNMDGWELAAHLSALRPRVPVLFMSGYDQHLGSPSLVGTVLAKPFTSEQLRDRVGELLGTGPRERPQAERQG